MRRGAHLLRLVRSELARDVAELLCVGDAKLGAAIAVVRLELVVPARHPFKYFYLGRDDSEC